MKAIAYMAAGHGPGLKLEQRLIGRTIMNNGKEYEVWEPVGFRLSAMVRLKPITGGKCKYFYDPGDDWRRSNGFTREID